MQPQFVYYADLEILEESGVYVKAQLYQQKDRSSVIVLHFCDDNEFEGLNGKYSMQDNKILDPDGVEIFYRNLSLKTNPNDSSPLLSECEVITANAKFGAKKLSSAFFRRHEIVCQL